MGLRSKDQRLEADLGEAMSDARVLAELMGWKHEERSAGHGCFITGWWSPDGRHTYYPYYDTDLNAMREVWKVLWDKGLWSKFINCWEGDPSYGALNFTAVYNLFNDLPGQIKAAIKVFKGAQG